MLDLVNYGEKYSTGDVISILLDFDDGTITFFKNGKSQGIAFKALKAAVIPAVSLTAKGCRVKMLSLVKSDGEEESICNVVVNNGSGDKWRMAKSFGAYYPNDDDVDHNVVAFQFDVIRDGKSSNTWRLCLGVVPIEYDITSDKVWVGAH